VNGRARFVIRDDEQADSWLRGERLAVHGIGDRQALLERRTLSVETALP
jgi:hypothetical protein